MAVAVGCLRDLRRQYGGQRLRVLGAGDRQHAGDAADLRGFGGDGVRRVGQHQHVDGIGRQCGGAAHAFGGARVELAVQVFGNDQNLAHQTSPFSFSAETSSATSLTITPRERLAGGA